MKSALMTAHLDMICYARTDCGSARIQYQSKQCNAHRGERSAILLILKYILAHNNVYACKTEKHSSANERIATSRFAHNNSSGKARNTEASCSLVLAACCPIALAEVFAVSCYPSADTRTSLAPRKKKGQCLSSHKHLT